MRRLALVLNPLCNGFPELGERTLFSHISRASSLRVLWLSIRQYSCFLMTVTVLTIIQPYFEDLLRTVWQTIHLLLDVARFRHKYFTNHVYQIIHRVDMATLREQVVILLLAD